MHVFLECEKINLKRYCVLPMIQFWYSAPQGYQWILSNPISYSFKFFKVSYKMNIGHIIDGEY